MSTSYVSVSACTNNPLKLQTCPNPCAPVCVPEKPKKECAPVCEKKDVCATDVCKKDVCKEDPCANPCADPCKKKKRGLSGFWIWLIVSIIILIILVIARPAIVVNIDAVTDQTYLNWLALIFWSALFGAIIWGIIALIKRLVSKKKEKAACEAAACAPVCAVAC